MNVLRSVIIALLLPLVACAGQAEKAGKARIITSVEKPAQCIAAVHVHRVDDREVGVPKLAFDLDAGTHTLAARTTVDTAFCMVLGPGRRLPAPPPLQAEFDAGKTYYVGYDHSSPHRKDWKLVIWKVEGGDQG
jgi:hypothetical protein